MHMRHSLIMAVYWCVTRGCGLERGSCHKRPGVAHCCLRNIRSLIAGRQDLCCVAVATMSANCLVDSVAPNVYYVAHMAFIPAAVRHRHVTGVTFTRMVVRSSLHGLDESIGLFCCGPVLGCHAA